MELALEAAVMSAASRSRALRNCNNGDVNTRLHIQRDAGADLDVVRVAIQHGTPRGGKNCKQFAVAREGSRRFVTPDTRRRQQDKHAVGDIQKFLECESTVKLY